jgi:hypothetical protein
VYDVTLFFPFIHHRQVTVFCLLRELTASQLVAIATRSDPGSHNRLDLMQSLVPPHYVCNGYVSHYPVRLSYCQQL